VHLTAHPSVDGAMRAVERPGRPPPDPTGAIESCMHGPDQFLRLPAAYAGTIFGLSLGNLAMSWAGTLKCAVTMAGGVWVSQSDSDTSA